jgi:hypothetical protein
LRYPCGVRVDAKWIWVADTYHNRIVVCDHEGRFVQEFGGYGWEHTQFAYPVAVERWLDYLFVVDSEPQRIQVLRLAAGDDGERPYLYETGMDEFGGPFVGNPFAVAVNRDSFLAISDRLRRCVWTVDLKAALKDCET